MKDFIAIIDALAWPVTVGLLVLALRKEIKHIAKSIANRVADPRSDVSISRRGVQVSARVDAVEGRVQSLQLSQDQIGALVRASLENSSQETATAREIPDELKSLANEYLEVSEPDWTERVRIKDNLAIRMANLVIERRVSKDVLTNSSNEGLLLALAAAVHSFPEEGDLSRLLAASSRVARLHVRYRFALALGELSERRYVATERERQAVNKVLERFAHGADPSLLRVLDRTRKRVLLARSEQGAAIEPEL